MRVSVEQVLSASASANGAAVDISQVFAGSAQVIVTGTLAGRVQLQVSLDRINPTNWSDLPTADAVFTTAGVYLVPHYDALAYMWLRAVFTKTGGAGDVTVRFSGRG